MIQMLMIFADPVILIGIRLLPEQNVLFFERAAQQHGLLIMDVVVVRSVQNEVPFAAEVIEIAEHFGGAQQLREAVEELQALLYAA